MKKLALILFWLLLCPMVLSQTLAIGNNTILSGKGSSAQGIAQSFTAKATDTGTLTTISVYVDAGSTTTRLIVGLGTDSTTTCPSNLAHCPGTLLQQSTISNPVAAAWNSAIVNIPVVSGNSYWFEILSTSGAINYRDSLGVSGAATNSSVTGNGTLTTLPSTWTSKYNGYTAAAPGSMYGSTAATAPPVTVSLAPTTATIAPCSPQQFTATVTNSTNTAVTWKTTGQSTINAQGQFCPGPVTETDTVTATSVADTTKSATATVTVGTVVPPPLQAATPTLAPVGGTFTATQTVTMSDATVGAIIYYTTDSSIPTSASNIYITPISVNSTTTLNALAEAQGYTNSTVASQTYTISIPVAHQVSLSWTLGNQATHVTPPQVVPVITAVNLYRELGTNAYVLLDALGASTTSFVDASVTAGQSYKYYVTEYASAQPAGYQESVPSNTVTVSIPTP